ncbi:MAG: hypothetical protein ACYC02_05660 [Thiobacillus sp.]
MAELNKKAVRTVNWALDRFYNAKDLKAPKSIEDFRVPNVLARELLLKENRVLLMSDVALDHLRMMVSAIHEADAFDGLANYGDVYSACKEVLAELISNGQRPDDAHELLALMRNRLSSGIDERTFAVPIFGVVLKGIECVDLGTLQIVRASVDYLDAAGVDHAHADAKKTIEATRARYWLVSTTKGTPAVAEDKFRSQAELAVGILAITAAAMYEGGAEAFRLGLAMSPEEAHGAAGWFSWGAQSKSLTSHFKFPHGQQMELSAELLQRVKESGVFDKALLIFQSTRRTSLEEAITRAVYWYADAQREQVPVMKLVKYWSCVETFFSAENNDIAHSLSAGIASVLVFGHFRFVPEDDYAKIKQRVTKLYDHRSRALHGASHRHVSSRDTADLGQWIAWMLLNMISFAEQGYTRVEQVKEQCERLDRLMNANK